MCEQGANRATEFPPLLSGQCQCCWGLYFVFSTGIQRFRIVVWCGVSGDMKLIPLHRLLEIFAGHMLRMRNALTVMLYGSEGRGFIGTLF